MRTYQKYRVGCVGIMVLLTAVISSHGQTLTQRQQLAADLNNLVGDSLPLNWQSHGTGTIRTLSGGCGPAYDSSMFLKAVEINGIEGYLVGRVLSGPDSIEVPEAAHEIICDLQQLISHALRGTNYHNDGGDPNKQFDDCLGGADCSSPGSFQRFFMVEVSNPSYQGSIPPKDPIFDLDNPASIGSVMSWTPSRSYIGLYRDAGEVVETDEWRSAHIFWNGISGVDRGGTYQGETRRYLL